MCCVLSDFSGVLLVFEHDLKKKVMFRESFEVYRHPKNVNTNCGCKNQSGVAVNFEYVVQVHGAKTVINPFPYVWVALHQLLKASSKQTYIRKQVNNMTTNRGYFLV